MAKRYKKKQRGPTFAGKEIPLAELKAILERAGSAPLAADEVEKLTAAVDALAVLTQEIETKGVPINRLRRMLFGAPTEKTSRVLGRRGGDGVAAPDEAAGGKTPKPPRRGHGRNGVADYPGAKKVEVPHASMHHGDGCPDPNCRGKIYRKEPARLLRVTSMAPLSASVYVPFRDTDRHLRSGPRIRRTALSHKAPSHISLVTPSLRRPRRDGGLDAQRLRPALDR